MSLASDIGKSIIVSTITIIIVIIIFILIGYSFYYFVLRGMSIKDVIRFVIG